MSTSKEKEYTDKEICFADTVLAMEILFAKMDYDNINEAISYILAEQIRERHLNPFEFLLRLIREIRDWELAYMDLHKEEANKCEK